MTANAPVLTILAAPVWSRVTEPEALGRFAAVALTLVLATVLYLFLRRGLSALLERKSSYRFLALRLLSWTYFPLVALVVLQELGFDVGYLWTAVSAIMAMVAIGFVAAWSLLSNVSAALLILSTRLFTVGDEVELMEPTAREGLRGTVVDLSLLFTTVEEKTAGGKGRIVTRLPNNIFFQRALRIRYDGAELPPPEVKEEDAGSPGRTQS